VRAAWFPSELGRDDGHYEIPITLLLPPSRKPMRRVALHHQQKRATCRPAYTAQEHLMLDVVMLALGLGFFVVSIGYAYACERL
jgi:hypothetical protein